MVWSNMSNTEWQRRIFQWRTKDRKAEIKTSVNHWMYGTQIDFLKMELITHFFNIEVGYRVHLRATTPVEWIAVGAW